MTSIFFITLGAIYLAGVVVLVHGVRSAPLLKDSREQRCGAPGTESRV